MKKQRLVRKAVIPIAGLGRRMGPLCKAIPKAMFPLVDAGREVVRPVVHHACMTAAAAGAEQVALIVASKDIDMVHRYFTAACEAFPVELPAHVDFLSQPAARGLGDAVLLAANYVGGEPFLVLLGDHVHVAAGSARPCGAQVVDAFAERRGAATIGVQVVGADELPRVGAARGLPATDTVYRCQESIEKPNAATARQRLVTPGLGADRFLAHAGIYLFTPEIFDCLRELTRAYRPAGEELQLTDAEAALLRRHPEDVYLVRIAGQCLDAGTPAGYAAAQEALRGPGAPARAEAPDDAPAS
jgi:UTP--glucose-1-phosphate uridylyltransferase